MYVKLIVIMVVFILGLYFVTLKSGIEAFNRISNRRCPNVLMQHGSKIQLYNSNLAKIPGVNPIEFDNLHEYVEFVEWQRSQGIRCPVLYLQQAYDVQGNAVYKARPDPLNLQGGLQDFQPGVQSNTDEQSKLLDASRDDAPYNTNSFPAYDQDNQYIGIETPLDKMFHESNDGKPSANAMDPSWGGVDYSRSLFDTKTKSEKN